MFALTGDELHVAYAYNLSQNEKLSKSITILLVFRITNKLWPAFGTFLFAFRQVFKGKQCSSLVSALASFKASIPRWNPGGGTHFQIVLFIGFWT